MTDKAEQPEKPERRKPGIAERVYLPAVMKGLKNTLSHVLRRQPNTMHYPEERRQPYAGYRGEH
ncbi:MAG: hypothetical protein V3T77_07990, partial [Planctomycetota bacterium]